jgi:two-component system chemotaxis response regulator CheB
VKGGREALRVLVVTGQAGIWRNQLVKAIETDPDATVLAHVPPADAVGSVRRDHPDMVSLDMAGLDDNGQAAALVRQILAVSPIPILLLAPPGQRRDASMAALVAGAVEVMTAPPRWDPPAGTELCRRLHALSHLSLRRKERLRGRARPVLAPSPSTAAGRGSGVGVVGLAASTGGPPALARVLSGLAGLQRPVVVVQHLQSGFVDGFLSWMRRESPLPIELAVNGAPLRAGHVLVVPPGLHGSIRRHRLELSDEPVTLHRPSADILFHSLAASSGSGGVGVILTGMGDDGASGLLAMRRAGAATIAQDAATSAVYGMPKAAFDLGAVGSVVPLEEIAAEILRATGVAVPA